MEPTTRTLLSEGVILGVASAYAYLATFLYEYGYCSYFAIPATLISPSLATVLIATAAIGGVFVSSLKLLGLSAPLFRAARDPHRSPYHQFFGMNAIFVVAAILLGTIYGFSIKGSAIFAGFVAVFELLYFGPVFLFDRKKPLRERFEPYSQGKPDQLDLPILFMEWFGKTRVLPFMLLGFLLLVAYTVGQGEAIRKVRFLTLKSSPDFVVLRNYGDSFIAARFDRKLKTISDELLILRFSDHEKGEFRNEIVGPLRLAN